MSSENHSQKRHLILRLEAPLIAFGGVTIDNYGFTRDFPARSMLTGLIANALGWQRTDREAHQALQDRLIYAARREREPFVGHLQDVQNARLYAKEEGWTTRGVPEGRNKASSSFDARDNNFETLGKYQTHQRFRDYHPDALVMIALRLEPSHDTPDLDDLIKAFRAPARPLFFGRKPCLPSAPLLSANPVIEAPSVGEALALIARDPDGKTKAQHLRAIWPPGEAPLSPHETDKTMDICDERNWRSSLHGGTRRLVEGRLLPAEAKEVIS